MENALKFITAKMNDAGLNYHFQTYKTKKIEYPYHIGSIIPVIPLNEDGGKEFTLLIDSFNRGTLFDLMKEVEKIEEIFPQVEGQQTVMNGEFVSVFFATAQPIDSGEEQLQRIQSQLIIKTWKGRS